MLRCCCCSESTGVLELQADSGQACSAPGLPDSAPLADPEWIALVADSATPTASNAQPEPDSPRSETARAAVVFSANIAKAGRDGTIGLDIVTVEGVGLRVKRIKDGLVSRWNEANPEKAIRQGDIISEINGSTCDTKSSLELVGRAETLNMLICRRC